MVALLRMKLNTVNIAMIESTGKLNVIKCCCDDHLLVITIHKIMNAKNRTLQNDPVLLVDYCHRFYRCCSSPYEAK
jgi:hypothetical protein